MHEWWQWALLGLLALFLLTRGMRGYPNVRLDRATLRTFLLDESRVEKINLTGSPDGKSADFAMQFRDVPDSVKYFRSTRGGNQVEILDVFRRGTAGFIVTFVDGKSFWFDRISGRSKPAEKLTLVQQNALAEFLGRIRRYAGV